MLHLCELIVFGFLAAVIVFAVLIAVCGLVLEAMTPSGLSKPKPSYWPPKPSPRKKG